jgi:hypothetical protein
METWRHPAVGQAFFFEEAMVRIQKKCATTPNLQHPTGCKLVFMIVASILLTKKRPIKERNLLWRKPQ